MQIDTEYIQPESYVGLTSKNAQPNTVRYPSGDDDDQITAIGELVTLPLVVLVSFMAQPRLLFAMAKDGLLPHIFAEVDSRGTLLKGSLVRRKLMVLRLQNAERRAHMIEAENAGRLCMCT